MLAQKFSFVFALTGAGLAFAQSLPIAVTPACSSTLQSFLGSPDAQCLNIAPLLSFVINPAQSIPQATDNWLTGLCGISTCTDANIANLVTNLIQGCGQDLSNLGVETAGLEDQIISSVQQAYPTIRQAACLKDTNTNELCVTQALNNVEQVFGKLVVDGNLTADVLNQDAQTFLSSNITQIACNSCAKAAYNLGMTSFPDEVSEANSVLQNACGGSILDRGNAPNIAQTALTRRSAVDLASTNSGFAAAPSTLASYGLLALLGGSAFLA
ncbi:hypothetical protein NP233_g1697 [Leucocoprinus birnbaumii]|uniref:Uncharacterized protein n=1 Tax=Leucocoprinus birnbaumii TaxID=56174 RepID=A0AAD5VZJ9_9AGAR|nr:hypothetical protein NP233_g1697 [Leucocoprinus birnbaumii]